MCTRNDSFQIQLTEDFQDEILNQILLIHYEEDWCKKHYSEGKHKLHHDNVLKCATQSLYTVHN